MDLNDAPTLHDVPRHFLHQILVSNLGELNWKNTFNLVGITSSNFFTHRTTDTGNDTFELQYRNVSGALLVVVAMSRCWEMGNTPMWV